MRHAYLLRGQSVALGTLALALFAVTPLLTHAQDTRTATPPLAFEVATVKADEPNKMIAMELRVYPRGRLVIHGHTLGRLITEAFDQPGWQVSGGEKWVGELMFDIEGKPPAELRDAIREVNSPISAYRMHASVPCCRLC